MSATTVTAGGTAAVTPATVTVMAVATAALMAVGVTVAAMMGNSGRDSVHD